MFAHLILVIKLLENVYLLLSPLLLVLHANLIQTANLGELAKISLNHAKKHIATKKDIADQEFLKINPDAKNKLHVLHAIQHLNAIKQNALLLQMALQPVYIPQWIVMMVTNALKIFVMQVPEFAYTMQFLLHNVLYVKPILIAHNGRLSKILLLPAKKLTAKTTIAELEHLQQQLAANLQFA
jgi:hypothetical protein